MSRSGHRELGTTPAPQEPYRDAVAHPHKRCQDCGRPGPRYCMARQGREVRYLLLCDDCWKAA